VPCFFCTHDRDFDAIRFGRILVGRFVSKDAKDGKGFSEAHPSRWLGRLLEKVSVINEIGSDEKRGWWAIDLQGD